MKNLIIVNSFPNEESKMELLREYLLQLQKTGYDLMLTSHMPLPEDVVKLVTYYFYDKENFLLPPERSPATWFADSEEYISIYAIRHSYAIIKNIHTALHLAKTLGYDNFIFSEYDTRLTDKGIEKYSSIFDTLLTDKKIFVFKEYQPYNIYNTTYQTVIFAGDIDFFIKNVPLVKSYEEWCTIEPYASSSEMIESMFVGIMDPFLDKVHTETTDVNVFFENSKFNVRNNVEYKHPIAYNLETPTLPIFFIVCNGGFYELFLNNELILSGEFPRGSWLKTKLKTTTEDSIVRLIENGVEVINAIINPTQLEHIKQFAVRGKL